MALLCAILTVAIQAAMPTVKANKLAAFMKQWETYEPRSFKFPMEESDRPLLIAALRKDPDGPWASYIAVQASVVRAQLKDSSGNQSKSKAAALVPMLKEADAILEAAVQASRADLTTQTSRQTLQPLLAVFLLEAGPDGLSDARAIALRMLDENTDTKSWNYGNVVFDANEMLGRVALRENKPEIARTLLRAAGQSPGSPQLCSFGPDLVLARELLEHGEQEDRETVLAFLTDISRFWNSPGARNANSQRVAIDHLKEIQTWRQQIGDGKIPNDPKWH